MAFTIVSTTADGTKGNDVSDSPTFSPDGTKIIFDSSATNLVAGTPDASENFFVKDLGTGAITRAFNVPQPGDSLFPVVSADDTQLTFQSTDTDLVPAANNGNDQIFVESATGTYALASSTPDGTQSNGGNFSPSFSADGTMVAFQSNATNLGSNPNSRLELFVKNLGTGAVQLVSSANGVPGNESDQTYPATFSPDGTKIAFSTSATNLVAGATDTNGAQLYLKNLVTGSVQLVSSTASGAESNAGGTVAAFSPDGTQIAFTSTATNLSAQATSGAVEIYLKNLTSGTVTLVSSAADGTASNGAIDFTTPPVFSPDGTQIAFASAATNLVPAGTTGGATQIYVKTLATGAITQISQAADGTPGNNASSHPAFSPDGTRLSFQSNALNLVPSNNNTTQSQIFVTDLVVCFASGTAIRITRGGTLGDVAVEDLVVGDHVVTTSGATRPIRWLGHRAIDCRRHPRPRAVMPVRIAAHALGQDRPSRDLLVSPGHAICIDALGEVLIPAVSLVNGSTIAQVEVDSVTYWHVELDSHDVILAENLPAESYLDMGNRTFFAGGIVALLASPDVPAPTHADFCRPYVDRGSLLEAVRARLAARVHASVARPRKAREISH